MSKVLVVDDHPIIIIATCRSLLEQDGASIVFDASDVLTGYRAFLHDKPDVTVVDLRLQGHDLGGLALIKRIRLRAPACILTH